MVSSLLRLWVLSLIVLVPICCGQPDILPPLITAVNGSQHFQSLVSREVHTFVKLFDPRCPHCVALSPHFTALAEKIQEHNKQPGLSSDQFVTIAEVDNSREQNKPIINAHALGFPTLKLFFAGRLVSEYEGPRRPQQMLAYIMSALYFRSTDLVVPLTSLDELDNFLNHSALRPVVISVFHEKFDKGKLYPPHVGVCAERWRFVAGRMRNGSAPNVAFASVTDPSLLVPRTEPAHGRFTRMRRLPYVPALAAAASGRRFWQRASWWYPGMHGDDSMEAFMHVNTLPENQYGIVNTLNARYFLSTIRPLVLAFGNENAPTWDDRAFLLEAARFSIEPRLVPLYVRTQNFEVFAEHVGVLGEGAVNEADGDSAYLLYRTAASRPAVLRYLRQSGMSSSQWLGDVAREVNRSNIEMLPGKVLDLDSENWDHVFQFDARGVLLELYRSDCSACKRFANSYENAAKMLSPHSGAIAVTRFDVAKNFLPESPKLPSQKHVPAVVFVPHGGAAVAFEGWSTPGAIANFARQQADVEHIALARLGIAEMAGGLLFQLGMVTFVAGLVIVSKTSRRKRKRDHIP